MCRSAGVYSNRSYLTLCAMLQLFRLVIVKSWAIMNQTHFSNLQSNTPIVSKYSDIFIMDLLMNVEFVQRFILCPLLDSKRSYVKTWKITTPLNASHPDWSPPPLKSSILIVIRVFREEPHQKRHQHSLGIVEHNTNQKYTKKGNETYHTHTLFVHRITFKRNDS